MNETIYNYLNNSHHMTINDFLNTTNKLTEIVEHRHLDSQTRDQLQSQVDTDLANLWLFEDGPEIPQITKNLKQLQKQLL